MSVRVRFAPSPTGNVHIGNIRVAIFNWLYARHAGGEFLLRVEDTDLERSTPEAIRTLLEAMRWLGLDYDGEPVYQSRQIGRHRETTEAMLRAGHAARAGAGAPTLLLLHAGLFDESFVTAPRDAAEVDLSRGELRADARSLLHVVSNSKGETFTTPINWDAMHEPVFVLEDGSSLAADRIREAAAACGAGETVDARALAGRPLKAVRFTRRYVFFDDLVLGRLEKPLDSLRDLVIVRSDGTPVFHLANVIDDVDMNVTHILRGNDHVENTFRHLFIFKALGATPPAYGHFPMIVNAKGKPYSKRDGDAYVGDFRSKGYLPGALFNFLALCGWSPGDGRELMTRAEMTEDFALKRVNASAAQLNLEKLEWMNGQYLSRMSPEELSPLVREALEAEGVPAGEIDPAWLGRLAALEQERLRTVREFVANTRFFFCDTVRLEEKAVQKTLLKNERQGLRALGEMLEILRALPAWDAATLERELTAYAEQHGLGMGGVAQPLRVAITGGTVSRGIWETLELLGREKTLARVTDCVAKVEKLP